MKGGTLQILWHGSDPVLSVDFHLSTGLLATAGADRDIKLWAIHRGENARATPSAAYKANLSHHNAAVNMLRFSPSGELLASGADNGELLIWKISQTENGVPAWKVYKILRGHTKDVLGLDWSSDDAFLVSCSVDNTCLIWNIVKGIVEQMVSDHQHYVQGVTWDPTDKYLASISGDRSCRIYSAEVPVRKSKAKEKNAKRMYHCQHVLCKTGATTSSAIPAAAVTAATTVEGHEAPHKQVSTSKQYLFHDENMQSFFRRLSWSPDGSFLLIPAGIEKHSPEASPSNVSYIVSRNNLSRPLLALPAASKPVVATRFCPVLFSLNSKKARDNDESGVAVFDLPYRIIFAVATVNSVYIYDTEKSCPIAILGGLHFATITDIAWSYDAKYLAISSQDGYCTLVGFDEGDLGTPARLADLPPNVASLLPANRVALLHSSGSIHCDGSHKDALPRDCTELAQKRVTPEKTPPKEDSSVGRVDVQVAGKTFENHSSYISKSRALRRIGPTPLPENLLPSASVDIKFDANRPTLDSGGSGDFDSKGCHPPGELDFRECKLNMEEVSAGASHLSAVKADLDRIGQNGIVLPVASSKSDCVDVSAGLESPNCKAKDEEAAASPQAVAEFSKNQPHVADTAQGPSTPLCRDHGSGLDVSPVTVVKPVDPYTDIYVRPLKFRRVSPCMVSHVDKEGALKSVGKEM